ncbi:MAG: tRNA (guanosine(37)-N1)-methyltransferase TrmD [Syntrophales bacterium]
MIRFDILSIFPEMFVSPLQTSLLKKAQEKGLIDVRLWDIRQYAEDKHHVTDDAPYGGGGGMVMKVEPIDRALSDLAAVRGDSLTILLTPQGEVFNQRMAEKLSSYPQLVLVCGHYEGIDERVRAHLVEKEVSIGDYVITGGELSALVLVDAVSRLIPGVLGNSESAAGDSFSMGMLEYPHYTRPSSYRGWEVPEVLLSGNHAEIMLWRRRAALRRTWERRPELLDGVALSAEDIRFLQEG